MPRKSISDDQFGDDIQTYLLICDSLYYADRDNINERDDQCQDEVLTDEMDLGEISRYDC
jgi:hypothetical protein